MTLLEAAYILGLTDASLRQAIARGSLKATKRGRDWWVTEAEVDRYLRENRRKALVARIHTSAHPKPIEDCPDCADKLEEIAAAGLPE